MKRGRWPLSFVGSLLLHLAFVVIMLFLPRAEIKSNHKMAVMVVKKDLRPKKEPPKKKKPDKKPEPPKKIEPKKKKRPPRVKSPKKMEKKEPEKPVKPKELTPQQKPKPKKPLPIIPNFGLKMEAATAAGGSVSVAVSGGTTVADPKIEGNSNKPRAIKGEPKQPVAQDSLDEDGVPSATMHQVKKQARVIQRVMPDYPEKLRRLEIEGKVKLELRIDEKGVVTHIKVLKSLHTLADQEAIKAARKMKFSPATVDGRAVAIKIPYTFTFVLE